MAKLDFPGSPTPSQKYPSPAVAGQPVYTWDGEKWTSIASQYVPGTAPFESAMAYSGMQINGGMEVSQELGATGRTTSGYVCDGWQMVNVGTMVVGGYCQQVLFVPGFPGLLFTNTATPQTTLGAGDVSCFIQRIEGYRVARLSLGTSVPQSFTIGFWSQHFRTGVYSGTIRNGALTRSYAFTYTHAASNVTQYNTVTIPGDTTGTWAMDNTAGMVLTFAVASGTTFTAPSVNTWVAGNYAAAPGQINGVAATSDVFRITGVTVLPGTQAPTAAQSPNIMRPYDQELATCQRYWQKTYASGIAPGGLSGGGIIVRSTGTAGSPMLQWTYPTRMRVTPTVSYFNPNNGAAGVAYNHNTGAAQGSVTTFAITDKSNVGYVANTPANGDAIEVHMVVDARL